MGSMSLMHWLVVLAIVLVLFGAGKLPRVMGDFAKGIKAFKSGMKEEDEPATPPAGHRSNAAAATATTAPRRQRHASPTARASTSERGATVSALRPVSPATSQNRLTSLR